MACFPQEDDPGRRGYCVPGEQRRPLNVNLSGQLAALVLISPEEGYTSKSREVTLVFDRVTGAHGYVLCIFPYEHRDDHCDLNVLPDDAISVWVGDQFTNGEFDVEIGAGLASEGHASEVYWTVASCSTDAYNCPGQGEPRALYVDLTGNVLAPPTLLDPPDGYTTEGSHAFLTWAPVNGAASSRVCIAYEVGACCPGNQTCPPTSLPT